MTVPTSSAAAVTACYPTARDDVEGDLTDQILTSGTVNTTAVGTYWIEYTVSDKAGNTSTVSRTVKVGVIRGAGGACVVVHSRR